MWNYSNPNGVGLLPVQAPCSAQAMSLSKRDWFRTVRREFLLRGIWGKTSRYLLEELEDHYQSTISAFKTEGIAEGAAEKRALEAMGDPKYIAQITSQELHPYWRLGKSCILITAVFLIILASGVLWLKWSGERDWKQAEAELRAKGEKLTFAELVPPMPPESENFFADPLWAEYADLVQKKNEIGKEWLEPRLPREKRQLEKWLFVPLSSAEKNQLHQLIPTKSNVNLRMEAFSFLRTQIPPEKNSRHQKETAALFLDIISPVQPVLARIAKLSERPMAQFPIRYDLGPLAPLYQLTPLIQISQILGKEALSELILGKNREAAADTLTLLRLNSILKNEPLMISYLVRNSFVMLALPPINEGILHHSWTESNLGIFQGQLGQIHLQKDLLFALRCDRAHFNMFLSSNINEWWGLLPIDKDVAESVTGKTYIILFPSLGQKNEAYRNLLEQKHLETLGANMEAGWNKSSIHPIDEDVVALSKNPLKRFVYLLNVITTPYLSGATQKTAECQTMVDQTMIACALERYRLVHGSYPASLDLLVPHYLAKLPNSPITGKPMNYSLKPDGTFLLWSPGWELKSLGGKPDEYRGAGDIVWGQPMPLRQREKTQTSQSPTPQ